MVSVGTRQVHDLLLYPKLIQANSAHILPIARFSPHHSLMSLLRGSNSCFLGPPTFARLVFTPSAINKAVEN